MSKSVGIVGIFTKQEVDNLIEYLQKNMPPTKVSETTPLTAGFEAVIESTLKNYEYIDLDSGKTFTLPSALVNVSDVNAMMNWIRSNSIDAQCVMTNSVSGIGGVDTTVTETYKTAWDQMSAEEIISDIRRLGSADNKPTFTSFLIKAKADDLPKTCLFKTREGRIGILQIIGFTDNPKGINIRYKMVQKFAEQGEGKNAASEQLNPPLAERGEADSNGSQLYQKQDSFRNALEFAGTPADRMDVSLSCLNDRGQLAGPKQLEFANKLFSVRKNKDVDLYISLLSDGTKKELSDSNDRRMVQNDIKEIKAGTFLYGEYNWNFFVTFRKFNDKDRSYLEKHVTFAEWPTQVMTFFCFCTNNYMLIGEQFYLIEDNGLYKLVKETLSHPIPVSVKKEQPAGPRQYGIAAFEQIEDAYTKQGIWKYKWDIELNGDVSKNNTFQIIKTTKVISGHADLHPDIEVETLIDESMIEKYKRNSLKFRFYVGDSEPKYNYNKYGLTLSGWSWCFSVNGLSQSSTMVFPGKDVTNIEPRKQGNFIGSDMVLLSFETSDLTAVYEHKIILRKKDKVKSKILTSVYVISLPAESNECKELLTADANGAKMLDSVKVEQLLKRPNVKIIAKQGIATFDGAEDMLRISGEEIKYISGYAESNEPNGEPRAVYDSVMKGNAMSLKVTGAIKPKDVILLNINLSMRDMYGFKDFMYKDKYPYQVPSLGTMDIASRVAVRSGQTIVLSGQGLPDEPKGKTRLILVKAEKVLEQPVR